MRRLFFGLRRRRRRRQRQVNTKVSLSPTLSPLRTPESEATDRSSPSRTTTARIITMSGETYPLTSSPIEDEPATYPSSSSNNDYGRNRNKIYQSQQQPQRPALTRSFSSEPTDQTPVRSSTKHERGRLGNGNAIGTYLEDQDTSLPLPARNVNVRQPSRIVSDITLPLELDDNEDDGDHYFSSSNSGRFTREDFMTDEQLHHLFSGLEALPLASKERQQQSSTEHSMKYSISSDGGGSDAKIFE